MPDNDAQQDGGIGGAAKNEQGKEGDKNTSFQDFIFVRELSEVYLLMDHISGRWDKNFLADEISREFAKSGDKTDAYAKTRRTDSMHDADAPGDSRTTRLKAELEWIEEICEIRWPNSSKDFPQRAHQAALLMIAKDRLNAAAKPASGMTIAFTLMVTGDVPNNDAIPIKAQDEINGPYALPSRTSLARTAFPGLVRVARTFNYKVKAIVLSLCAVLVMTCMLSWSMTSGYAILARLDALQMKKNDIQLKVEEIEKQPRTGPEALQAPASFMRFCDRSKLLPEYISPKHTSLPQFNNADEIHLCDRLNELENEFENSRTSLGDWLYGWRWLNRAYMERTRAATRAAVERRAAVQLKQTVVLDTDAGDGARQVDPAPVRNASDEEWGRIFVPLLLNSVLPFFYGILGAGASVVRHLRTKTKESLLSPRDISLAVNQLVLGATIGACIGLFVAQSASSVPIGGGFVGVAGLTGSALSFVAGFGVEGVFTALESLVRRVFNLQDPMQKT